MSGNEGADNETSVSLIAFRSETFALGIFHYRREQGFWPNTWVYTGHDNEASGTESLHVVRDIVLLGSAGSRRGVGPVLMRMRN